MTDKRTAQPGDIVRILPGHGQSGIFSDGTRARLVAQVTKGMAAGLWQADFAGVGNPPDEFTQHEEGGAIWFLAGEGEDFEVVEAGDAA